MITRVAVNITITLAGAVFFMTSRRPKAPRGCYLR
jgi:hypothetical protein